MIYLHGDRPATEPRVQCRLLHRNFTSLLAVQFYMLVGSLSKLHHLNPQISDVIMEIKLFIRLFPTCPHLFWGVVLWCTDWGAGFGCRDGAGEDWISARHVKARLSDLSTTGFPLGALEERTYNESLSQTERLLPSQRGTYMTGINIQACCRFNTNVLY